MIAVVAREVEHAGVAGRLHRIVEPADVVEPDHGGRARLPANGQRDHADRPLGLGALPEVGDDLRVAEVDVQVVERRVEGGVGAEEVDHDQPERQQEQPRVAAERADASQVLSELIEGCLHRTSPASGIAGSSGRRRA